VGIPTRWQISANRGMFPVARAIDDCDCPPGSRRTDFLETNGSDLLRASPRLTPRAREQVSSAPRRRSRMQRKPASVTVHPAASALVAAVRVVWRDENEAPSSRSTPIRDSEWVRVEDLRLRGSASPTACGVKSVQVGFARWTEIQLWLLDQDHNATHTALRRARDRRTSQSGSPFWLFSTARTTRTRSLAGFSGLAEQRRRPRLAG